MTQSPIARATIAVCGLGATLALGACSGSNASSSAPAATSSTSASTSSSSAPTTSSAPTSSAASSSAPTTSGAPTSSAGSPSATSKTSAAGTPSASAAAVITIKDFKFSVPASVAPGSMVMVTNADIQSHTITSKDGGFDVKVDGGGGTAVLTTPKSAGTYQLTCDFHANMSGSLVVK